MKITQQEREQYKLECRARHFASQWLGGEPTASVDEFIECKKRAFCFRHNVKSVEFDKDFLDEFRQGVDAHLDGEQFYLLTDLLETWEYFDRTYWGLDRSDPVMVYDLYEVGCDRCKDIEIKNLRGVLVGCK